MPGVGGMGEQSQVTAEGPAGLPEAAANVQNVGLHLEFRDKDSFSHKYVPCSTGDRASETALLSL